MSFVGEIYRYKNRNVSKKVYLHRQKLREQCLALHKRKTEGNISGGKTTSDNTQVAPGRRIVDINVLGQQLKCVSCNETLSLSSIEKEKRVGLASVFSIRCNHCLDIQEVATSKNAQKQTTKGPHQSFDVNSKTVLGVLNAGMGLTHLNKFTTTLNIPPMTSTLFKRCERIVGPAIETVARASCLEATKKERAATVENVEQLANIMYFSRH